MSYQEKKNIVSPLSAIVVFGVYSWNVVLRYIDMNPQGMELFRFWGAAILILIPVSMVARLLIEIIFIIINRIVTKEVAPSFADELDKIIELKAMRISYFVFILGFLLAMGSLVFQMALSSMFIIMFVSGFIADVAGISWRLYLYRKGV
ncbi:hypothetical protein SD70_22630 [Gordoniibacillus kamchatkensis]|uniref:Uncharacterized protein n=1 Tax=Gordoniibacillus kamchatkensis TaxID=1590651 RepID=A0ABR5AD98_9BACL|nr:hypothetical protein [Paenibacillus sp. VKM B-2647]KIL39024.1 hypothetical protein SD70_22630 [Paenibacillus sp. VKM B-2647]